MSIHCRGRKSSVPKYVRKEAEAKGAWANDNLSRVILPRRRLYLCADFAPARQVAWLAF